MSELRRLMSPIVSRVQALIGRAILAAVSDGGDMQVVKVSGLAGETIDRLDHPQPFGFTSHCPPGGQAVVAFVGGSRDQGIVLVIDHTGHRKKDLEEGESAHFSAFGTYVYLHKDGTVEVETNGHKMSVNGKMSVSDDVEVDGDVSDKTGTLDKVRSDLAALKNAYDVHVHPTAPPGPVSAPTPPPPAGP